LAVVQNPLKGICGRSEKLAHGFLRSGWLNCAAGPA